MRHTGITTFCALAVSLLCVLAWPSGAGALSVITEVESVVSETYLLNLTGQFSTAYTQVDAAHSVSAVTAFTDSTLAGVDIVYLRRDVDTSSQAEALRNFVVAGGRLIVANDHTQTFSRVATEFGIAYGGGLTLGDRTATVVSPGRPIVTGAGGPVARFTGLGTNDGLTGTNPDFEALAIWEPGENSLGYIPLGAGDIACLTDISTFHDAYLGEADNQALWTNLFDLSTQPNGVIPEPGTLAAALMGLVAVGRYLRKRTRAI